MSIQEILNKLAEVNSSIKQTEEKLRNADNEMDATVQMAILTKLIMEQRTLTNIKKLRSNA
jgi:hypothetical protein